MSEPILIVGIGNEFAGDDGVGVALAQRVNQLELPGVHVSIAAGDPVVMIDLLDDIHRIIVLDAVSTGAAPGTVHRIDVNSIHMPIWQSTSCHGFGLAETIELARALNRLPEYFVVIGIEGAIFTPGETKSDLMESAMATARDRVLEEIRALQGAGVMDRTAC